MTQCIASSGKSISSLRSMKRGRVECMRFRQLLGILMQK